MGKSSAPKTPNYAQAAQATAQGNLDMAKFAAGFNRVNQQGPYGSSTWSLRPGADPNNIQAGDYTLSSSVDPRLTGLGDMLMQEAGQGTQGVQDAYYRRATQRYDERFGQDEESLRNRLANEGFAPESEGFQRALADFQSQKNNAYRDATDSSILAGDQLQTSAVNRLLAALGGIQGAVPGQQTAGMQAVPGADLLGALQSKSGQDMQAWQANQQNQTAGLSAAGSIAAMLYM